MGNPHYVIVQLNAVPVAAIQCNSLELALQRAVRWIRAQATVIGVTSDAEIDAQLRGNNIWTSSQGDICLYIITSNPDLFT